MLDIGYDLLITLSIAVIAGLGMCCVCYIQGCEESEDRSLTLIEERRNYSSV